MAASDFEKFETVWKLANISKAKKIVIYKACVLQKLFVLPAHSMDTSQHSPQT